MKIKQYDNGNRFLVFDSSDSSLFKEQIYNVLKASNKLEAIIHNSPNSLKIYFPSELNLNKNEARIALNNILAPLMSKNERLTDIKSLENENPVLREFILKLHGGNYADFVHSKEHLVVSLYHFFLYDFVCNFKDSDMLWCLPFFERHIFDTYGNFDAVKLLKEFEYFKQMTVASDE